MPAIKSRDVGRWCAVRQRRAIATINIRSIALPLAWSQVLVGCLVRGVRLLLGLGELRVTSSPCWNLGYLVHGGTGSCWMTHARCQALTILLDLGYFAWDDRILLDLGYLTHGDRSLLDVSCAASGSCWILDISCALLPDLGYLMHGDRFLLDLGYPMRNIRSFNVLVAT